MASESSTYNLDDICDACAKPIRLGVFVKMTWPRGIKKWKMCYNCAEGLQRYINYECNREI